MKNYKKPLLLATVLGIVSTSFAQAGTLTIINKIPDQRVQLFIRGEGANTYHTKIVEAADQQAFTVEKEHVKGKNTFEVTASTGNGGDPDWKLMGGTCSNLVTDADHTILIDSTLGKVRCTNITAENPTTQQ